tara:strand:+ start:169 stop:465 length:297 start_codon:yes stop_codon:yes gene_type:complete
MYVKIRLSFEVYLILKVIYIIRRNKKIYIMSGLEYLLYCCHKGKEERITVEKSALVLERKYRPIKYRRKLHAIENIKLGNLAVKSEMPKYLKKKAISQ